VLAVARWDVPEVEKFIVGERGVEEEWKREVKRERR
jgi:hypothetical protein